MKSHKSKQHTNPVIFFFQSGYKKLLFMVCAALIFLLVSLLSSKFLSPMLALVVPLFVLIILTNLTVYILKKAGDGTLFLIFAGLLSYPFADFGITGIKKIFAFILVGILFEVIYWFTKVETKSSFIEAIVATTVSFTLMPIFIAMVISFDLLFPLRLELINLTILFFMISIIASFISYYLYDQLETTKWLVRLESHMQSLV